MSIFKDKVYEELDDISKLIEPYQCKLNEELSNFPDRVEIDPKDLHSSWGTSTNDIVRNIARSLELRNLAESSWNLDRRFFEFEIFDFDGQPTNSICYNFATNEIDGKIFLVKKVFCIEDDGVMDIIVKKLDNSLSRWGKWANSKRINEIADLFGNLNISKLRSANKKMRALREHMLNLVKSKKIDIRDAELADRFGKWIIAYINDGKLPALANITTLKIMTHQNKPIYSIDERSCE